MAHRKPIKVLVIDDSAYNRRTLGGFLDAEPDITVVGKACDGDEGLQLAMSERPDVITLDLEMPRMDGFTFLRILMAKRPTPVIVISSHAEKEKVFRALELGALDFVAKPTHRISPAIKEIGEEVVNKVRLARTLGPESLHPFAPYGEMEEAPFTIETELPRSPLEFGDSAGGSLPPHRSSIPIGRRVSTAPRGVSSIPALGPVVDPPRRIIALVASTGGPAALTQILTAIPKDIDAGILVVQHMPPKFTTTFAERLNKQCAITVKEVVGTDVIEKGAAYLAPGHACMEVGPSDVGLCVMAVPPGPDDRYVPSADRLIKSLASTVGSDVLAIVLTGMGDDGSSGVMELAAAGGVIVAEDESTAVVFGMPGAAVKTGKVSYVVKLDQMIQVIRNFLLL